MATGSTLRSGLRIIATVPTGFELGAAEECKEKLGSLPVSSRGRIAFDIDCKEQLKAVDKLRAIDNYSVVVAEMDKFCVNEVTVLNRLVELPAFKDHDWVTPLSAWEYYCHHIVGSERGRGEAVLIPEESLTESSLGRIPETCDNEVDVLPPQEDLPNTGGLPDRFAALTFRVTCTRSGRQHLFTSQGAARSLGAGIVNHFNWKVNLTQPQVEILLNIFDDGATICIALTREAKFKRNIVHFGPTTLRSTLAYGLLRLADINAGHIIVDPMCGGGSIPIEGACAFPGTFHLAGDVDDRACGRCRGNIAAMCDPAAMTDLVKWSVSELPLRTASVDAIVTDMPFGKKSGKRATNWELYLQALEEFGRVVKPRTGKAVLLTHDTKALTAAMQHSKIWQRYRTYWINIGGLKAGAHILHRTETVL